MAKSEDSRTHHNKPSTTAERKARKILKSCGLRFFKTWADQAFTGGKNRKKGSRGSLKSLSPSMYKECIAKGEYLDRKMDK